MKFVSVVSQKIGHIVPEAKFPLRSINGLAMFGHDACLAYMLFYLGRIS